MAVPHSFRERLCAGGACGTLIAQGDWSASPLGAIEGWSAALRNALLILLHAPVPMAILWGDDGVMLYNDAYSVFAGQRHPGLLGSLVREAGSEIAAFHDQAMRAVLAGGTRSYRDQALTLDRNGAPEPLWVNLDYVPVIDDDGRPGGVLCVLAEIADTGAVERRRQEADAALSQSEAQFRLMVDTVPQIIWITDANGRMQFLSHHFSIYTGAQFQSMAPAEIAAAFIHPEDGPHVVATFQAALRSGGEHRCEHRIRSASGEYRWFLDRAHPYRDPVTGQIVRWFGVSVDIHDRKLAEDRLHALNATLEQRVAERTAERNMLATLVENTDVMVKAIDMDFNILALNAANADEFERVFGVRPRAGDNILALLADQPALREEVRAGWAQGMRGEQVTIVEPFGDPQRDRPHYEISFRPLFDEAGVQIGAYQFVTDVTDRLRREAQLVEAQEALRQAQKMEAMGQLTGGVAHDFNNLLTPIVGTLDLLQHKGLGGAREQRLIAGAAQSAERARTLVQRLLAFARRQPLQMIPLDMAELVRGMGDLIASTTGPQIAVEVDIAPDLPSADADPNQLEMALLNLAVNARDAMPGGGTLRIGLSQVRVTAAQALPVGEGAYLRLSVADTGSGMDSATLARAIEPFFSTKGVGKGTGLGLSMVHGLASQLGGALHIDSVPGQGTRVDLFLPVGVSPAPIAVPGPACAGPRQRSGRVLLVDDEDLVRQSTADMLGDLGYAVIEAGSAEEAMRLIDDGAAFDLLVTDHLMPGMSGTDLARTVLTRRPGVSILLVSGYAEAEGIEPSMPRLAKPFRKQELAHSLSQFAGDMAVTA
ncbi:PAS domain-containing protein [uncultured Sphingomonas sp.]|uniref:PAS domain-containing protein n=1 Tax=uncultured Sphingomonas sp. TaxID=158754 RepID=UPI0025F407EA|nr:PAS domain-containing protein [uncultured Sphingomonas sp.]